MEEQAQSQPVPAKPPTIPPVSGKQTNRPLIAIAILVFLLMAGGLVFLGYQNYQLQSKIDTLLQEKAGQTTPAPSSGLLTSPSPEPTANWNTYSSQLYGFSIKYPKTISKYQGEWEYKEFPLQDGSVWIGFRPSSIGEDYIWGVNVYSNKSVEQVIKEQGQQFSDRKESRQYITVNGVSALLVTVTTNQYEEWVSKTVLIENNGKVYAIGNGAVEIPEFEPFYKSFKLIN